MRVLILTMFYLVVNYLPLSGQKTLHDIDTTSGFGKNLLGLFKKYDRLKFSGYLQPQFQVADTVGAKSYNGGDFAQASSNRFMLRRGRFRIDYANYNAAGQPTTFFVFQFDGTERGFFARDFWGRIFENRLQCFAFSTGIMARPFGNEILLGSGDRESPERGRMSQILMRTERDLGAMVTFEPRKKDSKFCFLKWDLMLANGQGLVGSSLGLSGNTDFDSRKDLISRIFIKPQKIASHITVSGGLSGLYGGVRQFTAKSYRMSGKNYIIGDDAQNIGRIMPRHYYGADIQLRRDHPRFSTEIRAEVMAGTQTSLQNNTDTPSAAGLQSDGTYAPLYTRHFNGAYFYLIQQLFSTKHQVLLKYDWYDPNSSLNGTEITGPFTSADIKYSTLGLGYIYHFNPNVKLVAYYDIVRNEVTALKGFNRDLRDNVFTCRMQFRF